jgi:succinate dehydrogenase / fumarate reductase flavoprotein subunit/fumarate reductase flavoprotein subunit
MYKITAASHDKACDGIAMGFRAGATLMDMEMVQFHPTGLLVGQNQISGTVLEEGLRGAGAYLRNGLGERYMERYDPRGERATRDVVSRSSYLEIMAGRGTEEEGVLIDISHLGAEFVEGNFPGMTKRCRDVGFDLAREPVTVSPTAHFMMGGIAINPECHTNLEGLFVAGEDAAGVHGANRLGGNGVAESTVFGGIAGDVIAAWVQSAPSVAADEAAVREQIARCETPLLREGGPSVFALRDRLRETMWRKAGVVRNQAQLEQALTELVELRTELAQVGCPGGPLYNLAWSAALNLENALDVSEAIVRCALARQESRGAHYRSDFPERNDEEFLCNFILTHAQRPPQMQAIDMGRMSPENLA